MSKRKKQERREILRKHSHLTYSAYAQMESAAKEKEAEDLPRDMFDPNKSGAEKEITTRIFLNQ